MLLQQAACFPCTCCILLTLYSAVWQPRPPPKFSACTICAHLCLSSFFTADSSSAARFSVCYRHHIVGEAPGWCKQVRLPRPPRLRLDSLKSGSSRSCRLDQQAAADLPTLTTAVAEGLHIEKNDQNCAPPAPPVCLLSQRAGMGSGMQKEVVWVRRLGGHVMCWVKGAAVKVGCCRLSACHVFGLTPYGRRCRCGRSGQPCRR